MIKDWLHNTFFDDSMIAWGGPVIVSNERSLSLSTTDADDTVSMAVDVDVSASLSASDEDDVVAATLTAPVVTKGTWTHDIETSGVIVWNTPVIVATGPAQRSLSLSTTDEDDTVSASIEHLAARSLLLDGIDEDDVVSCVLAHEEAEVERTSGGWGIDLAEIRRQAKDALEAQEAAERVAAEIIRQEIAEEKKEAVAARKDQALLRLDEIIERRRRAEEELEFRKREVERLRLEEQRAQTEMQLLEEEEEAVAIGIMMLLL
jgi:hypothetical protein